MKFIFLISLLFSTCVFADEIYQVDATYNIRDNNTNFVNQAGVIGQISKGTEFKIISSTTLPSGAKALQIEITKLGKSSRLPDEIETPMYLYQGIDKEFKTTSANRTTEAGTDCADGSCYQSAAQNQMKSQQVVQTAKSIVQAVETQAATAPNIDKEALLAQIQKYSDSAAVQKKINWIMTHIYRQTGGGKCYQKTKIALVAGGLIDSHYSDQYARNAVNTLTERGFVNLNAPPYNMNYTPETAPKGAILVYKSKVKCDRSKNTGRTMDMGCGHVEVKLGDGTKTKGFKYASDYKSKESILAGSTGDRYELVGVMVKLDM